MSDFTMEDVLVLYEYASKVPKGAGANFRWAILKDGRYLRGQNPPTAVRPDGSKPFWYAAPMTEKTTLNAEQLARVTAHVAAADLHSERVRPDRPTDRGDLARLTLQKPGQTIVYEVEDQETDRHEVFMGGLVAIFMPGVNP